MVLSLALARIRFAFWTSSTQMELQPRDLYASMPRLAAKSLRSPHEYPEDTPASLQPSVQDTFVGEPTWEDAEWQ